MAHKGSYKGDTGGGRGGTKPKLVLWRKPKGRPKSPFGGKTAPPFKTTRKKAK